MNIYVVVEGSSTEVKVYPSWISEVNKHLVKVSYLSDVVNNNYIIYSGGGYPNIYKMIENAIADTNANHQFDRLVVAMDSEDEDYVTRFNEVEAYILARKPRVPYKIVIQHFCIEAWALGNSKFLGKNPQGEPLSTYKGMFDVVKNDPELLPDYPEKEWNRARFAEQYLKTAIKNRNKNLTYSKSDPHLIAHPTYFNELKVRLSKFEHIKSFKYFIDAFS